MSNIIRHRIFFSGNQNQIEEMFKAVRDKKKRTCFDFDKIIPIPDTVYNGVLNAEALANYGDNNWYEWCKKNWGTHNGAYNPRFYGNMLEFETNYGVPRPIFKRLTELYPEIEISVNYANEDGSIVGKERYSCGNFVAVEDMSESDIRNSLWSEGNVTFL